ncbi:MAG: AAA family ATPase, partial [Chloroflexota bacterium]
MQLREIHIDGFGVFADTHVKGLGPGLNVLYGCNEFGKSTLLEFVRRVLFGFPSGSSKANPYPAVHGGAYGGRLVCVLHGGETVTISRSQGTKGGPVRVFMESGQRGGPGELDAMLGHISKAFYENVYGIGLDELERVGSLEEDEVKNRIYGAGLGLGGVSLTEVRNEFTRAAEALYKPQGSKQKMTVLYTEIRALEKEIREIQSGLAGYDEKQGELSRLRAELERLARETRTEEARERSLENQRNLYSSWLELEESQNELRDLEVVPGFSEDSLRELETREARLEKLDERIKERMEEVQRLEAKRKQLTCNEELLAREVEVVSLQQSLKQYESASADVSSVIENRERARQEVGRDIAELGDWWSEEAVRNFRLTHGEKDTIRYHKQILDQAQAEMDSAKYKWELHREHKLAEEARRLSGPAFFRYALYAVAGLSLGGCVYGGLNADWIVGALSGGVFVLSALLLLRLVRGAGQFKDRYEEELLRTLKERKDAQETNRARWREFLARLGLEEHLSPDGALEIIESVQGIQSRLAGLDEQDERIERMRSRMAEVRRTHDEVAQCVDSALLDGDIPANIRILGQRLSEAKERNRERQDLGEQVAEKVSTLKALRDERAEAQNELEQFLEAHGARDEEDFRAKYLVFRGRKELLEKIERARREIQERVGTGQAYESFVASMARTTPDKISQELEQVEERLDSLRQEESTVNQAIGHLDNEISQLSSSEDLAEKLNEVEQKKQQLQDCYRDWARLQIP